jgi:hypothetical protein
VTDSSPLLDRAGIEDAFRRLGERLARRGVDALFKPHGIVHDEALAVAAFAASPEHLLAMKAFAARPRDAEDIRQLAKVLDLHSADEILASVHAVFPDQEPPERLRLLLDDLFLGTDDGKGSEEA